MRKLQFTEGEFYHVYNRGTDKRVVFSDKNDYYRFLYLLSACNDTAPLLNSQHHYRGSASIVNRRERKLLVDILCICLMPNHYHLILRERVEGGIRKFMQKLGTGYTMYFNTKYKRSGVLFQGAFKAIHVDREAYFLHLTRYIHLNPAELREPLWKKGGIKRPKDTLKFVREYAWSSLDDYLGGQRLSPILNQKLIKELTMQPRDYESYIQEWITDSKRLIGFLGNLTLEE